MEVEKRKENAKWLLEGENGYSLYVKNERLGLEVFDSHNAMRLFEECLVDIYQQLENLKKGTSQRQDDDTTQPNEAITGLKDKLLQKIKKLDTRICVLEAHQKDDNSTLIN